MGRQNARHRFPFGTLIVNVVGCFLIAAIMRASLATTHASPTFWITLTVGFLGGLTTYSTFNYETTRFLQERAFQAAELRGDDIDLLDSGAVGIAAAGGLVGGGN